MKQLIRILQLCLLLNALMIFYSLFIRRPLFKDGLELGWPYVFYTRFNLHGNRYANHGWYQNHLIFNELIFSIIAIFLVYMQASKKK